jgi:hypothetical protein
MIYPDLSTRSFVCSIVDNRMRELTLPEHQSRLFKKMMAMIDAKLLEMHQKNGEDVSKARPLTSLMIGGGGEGLHEVSFQDTIMIAQSLGIEIEEIEPPSDCFNIPIGEDQTLCFFFSDFEEASEQVLSDFAKIVFEAYRIQESAVIPFTTCRPEFGIILLANDDDDNYVGYHILPNHEDYEEVMAKFQKG